MINEHTNPYERELFKRLANSRFKISWIVRAYNIIRDQFNIEPIKARHKGAFDIRAFFQRLLHLHEIESEYVVMFMYYGIFYEERPSQ